MQTKAKAVVCQKHPDVILIKKKTDQSTLHTAYHNASKRPKNWSRGQQKKVFFKIVFRGYFITKLDFESFWGRKTTVSIWNIGSFMKIDGKSKKLASMFLEL